MLDFASWISGFIDGEGYLNLCGTPLPKRGTSLMNDQWSDILETYHLSSCPAPDKSCTCRLCEVIEGVHQLKAENKRIVEAMTFYRDMHSRDWALDDPAMDDALNAAHASILKALDGE